MDMLDDVERARAAAYVRSADCERFVLACGVTRSVLGAHLSISPADVVLDRTCQDCGQPHGKVRVVDEGSTVQLSVSHSGDAVVVAFHRSAPVGVDVERIDRGLDHARLAEQVLTDAELAQLRRLHPTARPRAFTTYWARKEAIVKATGEGLRAPLREIALSAPDRPARLLSRADRPDLVDTLWLHDLAAPPGYVAAVAVLGDRSPVLELGARSRLDLY
jgi:4'-phosphopantetheinyl transferase